MSDDRLEELEARVEELEALAEGSRDVAQRALQRVSELEATVEEQEETIEDLRWSRNEHRAVLDALDDGDYSDLEYDEKVAIVRRDLIDRAKGKASLKHAYDYNDIRHEVFDGEPSPGHAYDLMEDAGDYPGFEYHDRSSGNRRVVVDLEELDEKSEEVFSPANKDAEGVGR